MTSDQHRPDRQPDRYYARLAQSYTLRGRVVDRLDLATALVIGVGNAGQRVAIELLLAGIGAVLLCDFARAKPETGGTQLGTPGERKIDTILSRPCKGRVEGFFCDVRHLGIGQIARAQLMIDCTDDAKLGQFLAIVSNALKIPMLRVALDGSGRSEMGRVSCSHGGAGYSCQLCTYSLRDLFRYTPRTPCDPGAPESRPPTRAGGAIGATIAGMAVLQALRLITGNDTADVIDRELVCDLTNHQLLSLRRSRSDACLSGHVVWHLDRVPRMAAQTTWGELLSIAQKQCGTSNITIEPFFHALCFELLCDCGCRRRAIGTRWMTPPFCPDCGQSMSWMRETSRHRITAQQIDEFKLKDLFLTDVGMPARGAMFVARRDGHPPKRIVLA